MAKTLVIAEPGCTHEGEWADLLNLLYTAKECGADCFKPQWTSDPALMCERRHIGVDHPKRSYYERAYRWNSFPVDWHKDFSELAHKFGMQYACSVYLPQDVATVAPFVDYLKIASFENRDAAMIAALHALSDHGRILVSTGMDDDLDGLTNDWRGLGADFLHCVSAYPAPLDAMHVSVVRELDGLSDHSRHLLTGALAVAHGAGFIETHFRLDSCDSHNPDYAVAFTPKEFTQYVQNIRDAEIMLGSGVKQIQECERAMVPYRVTT